MKKIKIQAIIEKIDFLTVDEIKKRYSDRLIMDKEDFSKYCHKSKYDESRTFKTLLTILFKSVEDVNINPKIQIKVSGNYLYE